MRFLDLMVMSFNNLRRRKLRTVLTVLGVVIGTASIVVMVSLGIGLSEMTMERIASYGSLTTIEVSSSGGRSYGGGVRMIGESAQPDAEPNYITDDVIKQFRSLNYVSGVSPVLNVNVLMRQGAYQCEYIQLMGVNREYMEQLPLGEGRLPEPGKLELVVGNTVITNFSNSKTGEGYYETGEFPDVDFKKPSYMVFDMDAYYQTRHSGGQSSEDSGKEGAAVVKPPKKYLVSACGMTEGGPEDWNNYSYNVYTDIEALKTQLKSVFKKGKPIPGQPVNKKGKPYHYFVYDSAHVFVDDMDHVTQVQQEISNMGYQVSSQMDFLESSQQQMHMVQAVLGGIGAVSLFVAAIGIANTMMMSIYERTREIGVMKVLGCDMGNIRNMFLIESGMIGLLGGILGIGLSYGVSSAVNRLALSGDGQNMMMQITGDLSRIPLWLCLAAVAFAVLVGMVAGFFPAMRAMKLSPLAAIRND